MCTRGSGANNAGGGVIGVASCPAIRQRYGAIKIADTVNTRTAMPCDWQGSSKPKPPGHRPSMVRLAHVLPRRSSSIWKRKSSAAAVAIQLADAIATLAAVETGLRGRKQSAAIRRLRHQVGLSGNPPSNRS